MHQLIPFAILLVVLGVAAFIGYSIYVWSSELAEQGRNKLATKNIALTTEGGLRIGVQEVKDEKYADKTQNVLVNVWNNAALPNYKSRLGWNSTQASAQGLPAGVVDSPKQQRQQQQQSSGVAAVQPKPASRSSVATSGLAPPQRLAGLRTPSTPGSWD